MKARLWSCVVTLVLFSWGLLGCASEGRPPHVPPTLIPPSRGGAAWVEITSKHFRLLTDAPTEVARETSTELERYYGALEDSAFRGPDRVRARVAVVQFWHEDDFRAITGTRVGWYTQSEHPLDLDPSTTLVFYGPFVESSRRMVLHELTHRFLARSVGGLPPFLEEGIAQYYSTLRLDWGSVHLGEALPLGSVARGIVEDMDQRVGSAWRQTSMSGPMPDFITVATDSLPPISTIMSLDRHAFLGGDAPLGESMRTAVANSLAAWAFVHMLHFGPQSYRTAYDTFIHDVLNGRAARQAWADAFRLVPEAALERDFHAYMKKKELTAARYPFTPRPLDPVEARRTLPESEIHVLWARLRMSNAASFSVMFDDSDDLRVEQQRREEAAAKDLDDAIAIDPQSAEARFWRGLFLSRRRNFVRAGDDLHVALGMAPDEPRFHLGLAATLFEATRVKPDDASLRELATEVAWLQEHAAGAYELDFLARYHQRVGAKDEALQFAQNAIRTDPTCRRCLNTYANVLYAQGHVKEAVAAKRRSMDLAPDVVLPFRTVEELRCFEKRPTPSSCLVSEKP
ncbi:tetratricopeptide repeat protein [Pendulispora rubella]|uniref:Tetratricopeptide repeat protein n=1 Tax=Pendulispora rubella TaxID=2741070 RepID=A0ABZ2LHV8_9BACT